MELSALYFPSALLLGALHALEPGHAKTLTAAYLIGTKGTKFDAVLLGLSVALTHSIVVIGLSLTAVWIGRESFTQDASRWLAIASGAIVILLGLWLLRRRLRVLRRASHLSAHHHHDHSHSHDHHHDHSHGHDHHHAHHHDHGHDHDHDHALLTDDEHAKAHAATLPAYVQQGQRPTALQIMAFGGAGGLIPCPAAITVMLLSLSVSKTANGLLLVAGFSLGLALTLVAVGLAVVMGLSRLSGSGRLSWLSRQAPLISAVLVILSGIAGLVMALVGSH